MSYEHYDITIIGGGIAGAGVAQAASAAGFKVLLLEQGEFAGQTSSSSSKLIHGGLRYLESGQLNLVYHSLQERRALLRLAPKLVEPIPFYIPVYQDSKRGRLALTAGLSLYALLAKFEKLGRFKLLPKKQWSKIIGSKITGLKTEGLLAVFQYWDAHTDDRQLTQAVIDSADTLGATLLNHAKLIRSEKIDCEGIGGGYKLQYQIDQHANEQLSSMGTHTGSNTDIQIETHSITTSMVINAAGPWVNHVLNILNPTIDKCNIDWVQGSHIILDIAAKHEVLYLESKLDDRVVFVMPWQGKTLVGTTETLLSELPEKIMPQQDEIDYLLNVYQHYFPKSNPQVVGAFAGVRVLPKLNQNAFSRPRESVIWQQKTSANIISLYGGKLTTFRSTSKQVLALIEKQLGKRNPIANVDQLTLS